MPAKDILEKTLEAYNDVFADICNGLLFQGRPIIADDALSDAQPFSFYKADGVIHEQERDVSKYWLKYPIRIALLGFENQTDVDKYMPLRVIGYDGAAYRAQMSDKNKYPVLTLVLYFGNKRWKSRNLLDSIDIPEELRPFISDYRINVFEIAYLSDEQINYFHSDFKIVADYFAHRRTDPNYRPKDPQKFVHANELLKLMAVLANDHRFADTIDPKGGTPKDMCEVLDRVEQKGIHRGELIKAKATAFNMRDMMGVTDPGIIAKVVGVATELVERWFSEEK